MRARSADRRRRRQERKLLEDIKNNFIVNLQYAFQDDENMFMCAMRAGAGAGSCSPGLGPRPGSST